MAGLNEEQLRAVFSAALDQGWEKSKRLLEEGRHGESPIAERLLRWSEEVAPGIDPQIVGLIEAVSRALLATIEANNAALNPP